MRRGGLATVADSLAERGAGQAILVMPDGDDSWYTTWNALGDLANCRRDTTRAEPAASYCVPWPHYDDYIAHDLVARVDSTYRSLPDRSHRAIAGLSMGGYGAFTLALRYPDVFSAAVSHSGVLAPLYVGPTPYRAPPSTPRPSSRSTPCVPRSGRPRSLPLEPTPPAGGPATPAASPSASHRTRPALLPALYADVGLADPFVDENRAFRDHLAALGVPLAYHEWPGDHSWPYWRAHVGEGLAWLLARFGAS